MCIFVMHDELRRVVTSFKFRIAIENICCRTDVMIENFVVTLHDLKRLCVIVLHGEPRRVVTSFEFRIEVKNICCGTDVMIEIFVVTLHDLKHGCVHSCGMTSCDVL
jgi:hypothetical protein